jgi:hypothetical protein
MPAGGVGACITEVVNCRFHWLDMKLLAGFALLILSFRCMADPVRVRYIEGVTLGFLVLEDMGGKALAYGELNQVVSRKDGVVTDDLRFQFKDGSSYHEVTKFTQEDEFRLVSDHVVQKGAAFKQNSDILIEAATGTITIKTSKDGKEQVDSKHLDLPPDVCNGLLFTLVKNLDPAAAETTVTMVAPSTTPRLVKLTIVPAAGTTIGVGLMKHKAEHYIVRFKIGGVAGIVAHLVGKQPPDMHIWVVKSEAPTFVQSEGPLYEDGPVWRIRLTAPRQKATNGK